jgi:hypothetical protein
MPSKNKVITTKEEVKHSSNVKYLHLPHGELLRGIQIQSGSGYDLPNSTDVHTFSTKKRIKNKM